MKRTERIHLFVQAIWQWYSVHKRSLPWRDLPDTDATERAYKIMVSEIMLQQTQVPRVIVTYRNFLERFPTIRDLASASNKEVLIAWRGMGYNSRALRLRDAARKIVGDSNDDVRVNELTNQRVVFPMSMTDLTAIPGIGHYTAAAIRNFAFGIPTPCIDTNIRRILHRTFVGPEKPDGTWEKGDKYLLEIAEEVLEEAIRQKGKNISSYSSLSSQSSYSSLSSQSSYSSSWHAALMDFGSLVQTKRNPKWELCPLTREGIMKTSKKNYELRIMNYELRIKNYEKKEPGRMVGSTYIPNRIFRGRVVEALRDAEQGMTMEQLGREVCIDWDAEHRAWLKSLIQKLVRDSILSSRGKKYVLSE